MYDDVEEASSIRAIRGSHDCGLPMEHIFSYWPCHKDKYWELPTYIHIEFGNFQHMEKIQVAWHIPIYKRIGKFLHTHNEEKFGAYFEKQTTSFGKFQTFQDKNIDDIERTKFAEF